MSTTPMNDRVIDLEIRLAHQDAQLQDLNDVVTRQQQDLLQMQRQMEDLRLRLAEVLANQPGGPEGPEPPPPHY
ncbi:MULTISPECIES: SlyX family protein [Ectothiorhodospira]|jgi:SlyX protein|uniref:Protein SlyX homolog n=1 Tax=Ectothiorhodospira marina TaxID=1396821 RepID=A0A1H7MCK7_9GAMM|nr:MULTISPECIES: SlyX family protein [Ectothiorhodospira]MCG5514592.1 SlyX family protein [Ectothiorhodospira sp. 9100]MCG5518034.1 SlyX family protein [Ectothiorhodospira sp. 9905]SEL08894.1 SlyX protein [Ectothiorhodospira marina]